MYIYFNKHHYYYYYCICCRMGGCFIIISIVGKNNKVASKCFIKNEFWVGRFVIRGWWWSEREWCEGWSIRCNITWQEWRGLEVIKHDGVATRSPRHHAPPYSAYHVSTDSSLSLPSNMKKIPFDLHIYHTPYRDPKFRYDINNFIL